MRRGGTILIAVLVITSLVTMLAMGMLYRMRAEAAASSAAHSGQQAYAVAMSALFRTMAVLQTSRGDMAVWYDNPDLFRNQFVTGDGRGDNWYFTLYAPNPEDPTTPRSGLIDEAGNVNINVAPASALLALPNMTGELADCLMDYRDRDSEPRPEGAEQEYYDHLPTPYLIRNGPFSSLEELLLVKGFTGSTVYGEDYNLNGVLDKNEDDGDDSFPPDSRDGMLDTGLMGMVTVVSYERDVDSAGRPRVNLNGPPEALAGAGLGRTTLQFIAAYRADGNAFRHPSELLNMRFTPKRAAAAPGGARRGGPGGGTQELSSGVTAANLAGVLDKLTTRTGGARAVVPGLINVNTASKGVLSLVPGMDENTAGQILDARQALEADKKTSIAWLVAQNVVDAAKFKQMAPYLTARSLQFRMRCVAFAVPSGRYYVLEAVLDLAQDAPRILYLRDLTHLGMPVPVKLEELPNRAL